MAISPARRFQKTKIQLPTLNPNRGPSVFKPVFRPYLVRRAPVCRPSQARFMSVESPCEVRRPSVRCPYVAYKADCRVFEHAKRRFSTVSRGLSPTNFPFWFTAPKRKARRRVLFSQLPGPPGHGKIEATKKPLRREAGRAEMKLAEVWNVDVYRLSMQAAKWYNTHRCREKDNE